MGETMQVQVYQNFLLSAQFCYVNFVMYNFPKKKFINFFEIVNIYNILEIAYFTTT